MHLFNLFFIFLQMTGIHCFVVHPEDVIANVGDSVSFYCATNASSSARRGIRWIYTFERNFRRPSHICVDMHIFPKWKMRHTVTESTDHNNRSYKSTLTISSVNSNDDGFYTCMDLADDSKATAQLKTFTDETTHGQGKVRTKGRIPIFIAMSPVTETYSNNVPNITIRMNQSVSISAGAKEEDIVTWLLSPSENSTEYITLYDDSGEISRKDGCEGYHFGKNHSIFIASAQPCHAGTYTVDIRDGDSRTIVLIVDDTVEDTISYETTDASGTKSDSSSTPAPDGQSQITVIVSTVIASIVILALAVLVIGKLRSNENCRSMCCSRGIDNNGYIIPVATRTKQFERDLDGRKDLSYNCKEY